EEGGGDTIAEQVAAVRQDRGHAGVDAVALYHGRVTDSDTRDIRDRVERARLEYADDDAGITRSGALSEDAGWESNEAQERDTSHTDSRCSRCCLVAGQSDAMIENRTESRGIKSAAIRCPRKIPSNWPPIRASAARERSFRESV